MNGSCENSPAAFSNASAPVPAWSPKRRVTWDWSGDRAALADSGAAVALGTPATAVATARAMLAAAVPLMRLGLVRGKWGRW